MATRPKTPGTPVQRDKTVSGQGDAAPAKPKARRGRSPAAEQPDLQDASASHGPAEQAAQPQAREASSDPLGQPAAMKAGDGREGRASEAIRALSEMVAAGIDALAELRAEVREVSRRLDRLAADMPGAGQADAGRRRPAVATSDAEDYAPGRDRDPGDAVPSGVATMAPAPLTETDEAVLHTLEELPKRTGRGKRGPRAKA
jgi:hypothetical protein